MLQGITLNVGLVEGGSSINPVAAKASGEVDVRFVDGAQRERMILEIETILGRATVAGTTTTFERQVNLCRWPRQRKALRCRPSTARRRPPSVSRCPANSPQDGPIPDRLQHRCADGLCDGAVAGKAHTQEEYILVKTLSQRAAIVASSILLLAD